ncbi:MAG: Hsp70 family protein [Acidimicrobiales bacterium]|nr:Hsp70 family protein [Acidimicrobiales bacterium]
MVYDLGIDVGTSYTAAAIRRADGTIEVVGLGPIADNIPSVVYLNDDGSLIVGDAASRRAAIDPAGAAREFKRRLGDPTPLILRTSPFSAEALIAKLIEHVTARVTDRERDRPRHTVVTHPANWGPYKLELFDQAFRIANVEDHSRLPEPQAAAMAYAAEARVPTGSVVAVYDLGGGTFDAAVLRKTDRGFEPLGESVGIEHLGGVDFDEAVLHHVRTQVGDRWPDDPNDPSLPAPMLHLRRACMEAKELLSSETDVQIPVLLPGIDTTISLTRVQFEAMITPRLEDSISALDAAIASAGVRPDELNAVLMVGGSSRIPLVSQMLTKRFGGLVAGDIDPLYAVARGAALAAGVAAGDPVGSGSFFAGPAAPAGPAGPPPGVPQVSAAPPTILAGTSPAAPAPIAPVPVAPAAAAPPPSAATQPPPAVPFNAPPPAVPFNAPPPVMHGSAAP